MIHINTTPLAFHERKENQSFNLDYSHGRVYGLVSSVNRLLPFQIIVDKEYPTVSNVYIVSMAYGTRTDISSQFTPLTLARKQFDTYDILVYSATKKLTSSISEGKYYLEIHASDRILYSEPFTAIRTVQANEIIGITYWDNADFVFQHTQGRISYAGGYRNTLYLQSKLAKPEYKLEEVVEDRDGFKFVEKQIQKKLFRFSFLATEELCDVISMIGMHDNVVITHKNKIYTVFDILFTPTWTDDGFLANVDSEFTTDAVIKKIGKLFPKHNLGDFNSDFNTDFNVI